MALTIVSKGMCSAQTTENVRQPCESLTNPLPPFKLISEDILVNIFSRLEEDPRNLARLACVCRIFAHVVRNVCWKRQCTKIVPDIMPSPQAHLDQIPEPPGGWGALLKLLVCCTGTKHVGIVPASWDFGLESELGPTELYDINPRPHKKVAVDIGNGSGELTVATNGDASVSETGNLELKAGNGNSFIRSDAISSAPPVYLNSRSERSSQVGKSAVNGDNGYSTGKYSSSTMDLSVQAAGRGELEAFTGDPFVQCNSRCRDSVKSSDRKCLTMGVPMVITRVTEKLNGKSIATKSQAVVEACMQGTGSGESEGAHGDPRIQSFTEVSNGSVLVNQDFVTGSAQVGTSAVTENDGRSSIDLSSNVRVQRGSGRPPRKPVKQVHWKEEELASKTDEDGSKVRGSGEVVTDADRRRCRIKRKERALRRILAKVPEDPNERLHVVRAEWTVPREEGSRLLASRFRCDSLYICDWPGCVHPGEKRDYKLFRGFFKNFKTSLMWRNLKDMNTKKTNIGCAYCSSTSTWDMMTAFCLRRSFEYHDDGEPVVHASVCENGHVSGAWTDRPGALAAL